jgi:hypothetical protein
MLGKVRVWAVLALGVALVSACIPPPATDADNATGTPGNEWGWFESGQEWRGDFGDPHVLLYNNVYYAYSSPTGGRYLPVLTSTDLQTWRIHKRWSTSPAPWAGGPSPSSDPSIPIEIRQSAMSDGDKWNMNDGLVKTASWGLTHDQGPWIKKDLWAPGVAKIGDTWYAYSAVKTSNHSDDPHGYGRFCITVASASAPGGPFRDSSTRSVVCDVDPAGSIDPAPYFDPVSNAWYLTWKAAGRVGYYPSALKAQRLGSNGRFASGSSPVTLLQTKAGSWEGNTIENPSMVRWGGTTYLFYAGNDSTANEYGVSNYGTGWAVCPQGPLAPCKRLTDQPLLASGDPQQGPAGGSAFVDKNGELRFAYSYYWLGENRPNTHIAHPRRMAVVRVLRNLMGHLYVG